MNKYKKLRLELRHGLSLNQVAREMGVNPSTICRVENDLVKPGVKTLIAYSEYFDIPIDKLIYEEELISL